MKATRKGSMSKNVEDAITRWNRRDRPIKQVEDCTESLRSFLENFGTEDFVGYARALYLKHSTRPGIAEDYAAISSSITLMNFLERWEGVNDPPLDIVELERVEREGLDFGKKGQDA
jgi:hypothetical protein